MVNGGPMVSKRGRQMVDGVRGGSNGVQEGSKGIQVGSRGSCLNHLSSYVMKQDDFEAKVSRVRRLTELIL